MATTCRRGLRLSIPVVLQHVRCLSSLPPSSRILPPLSLSDLFHRSRWSDSPRQTGGPLSLSEILFFTDRIVQHLRLNREHVRSLASRAISSSSSSSNSSSPPLSAVPLQNMHQVLDATIVLLESSILSNAPLHAALLSSPDRHGDVRKKVREVNTRLTVQGSFVDWLFSFCSAVRRQPPPPPLPRILIIDDEDVHELLKNHFAASLLCDHVSDLLSKPPMAFVPTSDPAPLTVGAVQYLPNAGVDLIPVLKSAVDEVCYLSSVAFPDKYFDISPLLVAPPSPFPTLPLHICPSFLRFATVEVLKNAVGALAEHEGKAPKPTISLRLPASSPSGGGGVNVHISDHGIGFRGPSPLSSSSSSSSSSPLLTFGARPTQNQYDRLSFQVSYMPVRDPLKGVGAGLWLSGVCMDVCNGGLRSGSVSLNEREDGMRGAEATIHIVDK